MTPPITLYRYELSTPPYDGIMTCVDDLYDDDTTAGIGTILSLIAFYEDHLPHVNDQIDFKTPTISFFTPAGNRKFRKHNRFVCEYLTKDSHTTQKLTISSALLPEPLYIDTYQAIFPRLPELEAWIHTAPFAVPYPVVK